MSKINLTIKNWDKKDRPREKLLEYGPQTLSNAELLAILIGSGNKNLTALDLAKKILAENDNNLDILGRKSAAELLHFQGIGQAKAVTIVAALELAKRRNFSQTNKIIKISSSKDVFNFFCPLLCDLKHEEFWLLTLNTKNEIISKHKISQGGISEAVADLKIILKKSLIDNASSIIAVHNHPSGNPEISNTDKNTTLKIKNACNTLDIKFLDHIIIGDYKYFSFADKGLL